MTSRQVRRPSRCKSRLTRSLPATATPALGLQELLSEEAEMRSKRKAKDEKAQRENAEALQRQIDDIAAGHLPKAKPGNLRDLFNEKMAEDATKREEE